MMRGDGDVMSGWKNKLQPAVATDHAGERPGGAAHRKLARRVGPEERYRPSAGVYVKAFAAEGNHHKEDRDAGKDPPQEIILKVWRAKGRQEIRRHSDRTQEERF
jgi:hypothetical protein